MPSDLLDTNTVIYSIKNRPAQVRNRFKQHQGQMCVSTVTVGELVFGAERSAPTDRDLKNVEAFLARLDVLPFDDSAPAHFGQIRAELYSAGRPIVPYDMMIAGQARSQGPLLVTNNTKEFDRVPGVRIDDWV